MTEDEMAGWHHQLDGYEFEQALGVGDRQGSLMCCRPGMLGCKESNTTEGLNRIGLYSRWSFPGQNTGSSVQCSSVQFSSVTQSCLTLWDPMNCSMPGLPVHHQLPEFTQIHVR